MHRVRLILALLLLSAGIHAGAAQAGELSVGVTGSVPGFTDAQLSAYLVDRMNAALAGAWHFRAAAGARDRVEWSFRINPMAAGSVRTYGFSRAMMERLIGSHQPVTIEVRLYLKGEYQTLVSGSSFIAKGPTDEEFAREIDTLTRLLIASLGTEGAPGQAVPRS